LVASQVANRKPPVTAMAVAAALLVLSVACSVRPSGDPSQVARQPDAGPAAESLAGSYAKLDPSWPQWWLCRRCADYRPAGGLWHLTLADGRLEIGYDLTGWTSSADYAVEGDQLTLSNDPYCPQETGLYQWKMEPDGLRLTARDDGCAFGLRAQNLGRQPWTVCHDTAGQQKVGCGPIVVPTAPVPDLPPGLAVRVSGGDSRKFDSPPVLIVPANGFDNPSPAGIGVVNSSQSIRYGLSQVLWGEADWVEVTIELAITAAGVQFFGDPSIGWASVVLDGTEVWRGDTAAIWSQYGRHGGYVEMVGLGPGPHTLRVESLGFDYHPVTVAWFGFGPEGGVDPGEP